MSLPIHIIDEKGDTFASCETINIGGDRNTVGFLKLSSKALSLASPSFPKLLRPQNTDNHDHDCSKTITLEVESLDSALLVMRIIHFRNSENPRKITIESLSQVAVFSNRYKCQEAVGPSVELWAKYLWSRRKLQMVQPYDDYLRWLRIGKVFKIPSVLETFAKKAVFEIDFRDGTHFHLGDAVFERELHDFAAEYIFAEREELLRRIIDVLEEKLMAIEQSFKGPSNRTRLLQTSQCHMTGIAIIQTIKLQLGYPNQGLDCFTLTEICDTLKRTCAIAQLIEDCPHRGDQSEDEMLCHLADDILDVLEVISMSDPSKPVLKGAGITPETPGTFIELEDTAGTTNTYSAVTEKPTPLRTETTIKFTNIWNPAPPSFVHF
ncbi:hypothetical protein TWF506_008113 [Arthrobotrys conoides]|uniref:BTB domain-containing protein n=1 Tax=Arthrobotrys conoides TaxID=74498 RepID=A0AAN8NNT1_9PEZI